jgi:hypothetical protein
MAERVVVTPKISKKHRAKFPHSISFAGMKLPLVDCDKIAIHDAKTGEVEGFANGAYNAEQGTIFLHNGPRAQLAQETLMHECIHAVDALYHLDLTEEQVRFISMGVANLIFANPIFRKNMADE